MIYKKIGIGIKRLHNCKKNKSVFRVIINKGIIICYIERERKRDIE